MNRLARFRADPNKICIRIRKCEREGWWQVVISTRGFLNFLPDARSASRAVAAFNKSPTRALAKAFQAAEKAGFIGIDRYMDWSYQHPMWKEDKHALS